MSKHFFITGLVRSKTGWLSNLLTWGPTFCWHDAFYGVRSDAEFNRKMDFHEFAPVFINAIGIADAALTNCWVRLNKDYPEAKWVVIERDFEDVFLSAQNTFEIWPNKEVLRNGLMSTRRDLEYLCSALKPKVMKFDDLGSVDKCYELASYLGVVIGPRQRVQQLCDMNIQIHPPILRKRLEALKCQQIVDTKEAA